MKIEHDLVFSIFFVSMKAITLKNYTDLVYIKIHWIKLIKVLFTNSVPSNIHTNKNFKTIISRHNCFCELEFTAIYCQIKQRPIGRLIPESKIMEEQVAGTK